MLFPCLKCVIVKPLVAISAIFICRLHHVTKSLRKAKKNLKPLFGQKSGSLKLLQGDFFFFFFRQIEQLLLNS